MTTSFNLLDEPWITVRQGTTTRDVSLLDVFRDAHEIDDVVGELPTVAAAIRRLLYAIVYRAFPPKHTQDDAIDQWEQWWNTGGLPADPIVAYLEKYRDRFYLLSPSAPFFQVAGLSTSSGNTSGIAKLIAEVPPKDQFFTVRSGTEVTSLSLAEAARWLVHCQTYDASGIKTGVIGDDRVKGGRGYPIGTGWTGAIGLVEAQGASWAETMLLNVVSFPGSSPEDMPPWERPPLGPAIEERAMGGPLGPAQCMTWQVRRIRLVAAQDRVIDALIANGDPISPQNRGYVEPMSAWRFSEPQTKKLGRTTFMPLQHDPNKAIWRGFTSWITGAPPRQRPQEDVPKFETSALHGWLTTLRNPADPVIGSDAVIRWRATGIVYGSNQSVVESVFADSATLHVAVLTDVGLRQLAADGAASAESGVSALRSLAGNLADAIGTDRDGPRQRASEMAYPQLDGPFRSWLLTLGPKADIGAAKSQWEAQVATLCRSVGDQMCRDAGIPALIGHDVTARNGSTKHMDTGLASRYFHADLRKRLPLAFPEKLTEEASTE